MSSETISQKTSHVSSKSSNPLEHKQAKGFSQEAQANQGPFFSASERKGSFFQTKLTVNKVNDPYEVEADRVAEEVTQSVHSGKEGSFFPPSGPESGSGDNGGKKGSFFQRKPAFESPSELDQNTAHSDMVLTKPISNLIQRKPAFESDVETESSDNQPDVQRTVRSESSVTAPLPPVQRHEDDVEFSSQDILENKIAKESKDNNGVSKDFEKGLVSSKGGGNPLNKKTKNQMESAFSTDFSGVRIHNNTHAESLNNQVQAKAFTHGKDIYFNKGTYQPESKEGTSLLAHELTHVVQQGGAKQSTVRLKTARNISTGSTPKIQRGIISRARNWAAGKAANIPGYTMLSVIIGYDIIKGASVTRNAQNIFRGIMGVLPGGEQIYQALNNHGIFTKVGNWIQQQLETLGDIGSSLKDAFWEFLDSLGLSDLANPGGAWRRLKRIFSSPVSKIKSFIKGLAKDIIQFIKDAILRPLADLASRTRAWDLLIAILGVNPITGDKVPQTADTIIGGFMKLIGQEEIWENIKKANAVARAWQWMQTNIKAVVALVSSLPTNFINALKSLTIADIILVPRAYIKVGKVFLQFAIDFASWALGAMWDLLKIIFEVVAPAAVPYLNKSAETFKSILANPMGFVGNLIKAGKLGFEMFKNNFLGILKEVLLDWLTGTLAGAGIYIPQSLDFFEILKFILSILGLTWENIRAKLVEHLGEGPVVVLEEGFELIQLLVTEGPAAAWEKVMEHLANLKEMVISEVINWVTETVVKKAIVKLVAVFVPGGGFITAIVAIYDTILVFIQRLQKIIEVGKAVMASITQIAEGNIQPAAEKIVRTLKGLLVLAVSFLAGFVGLGKIGDALQKILKKIRDPIDKALDQMILWVKKKAKSFLKGKDDQKHQKIGKEIKQKLGKAPANKKQSFDEFYNAKVAEAKNLEGQYQGQLKQGVKLTISYGSLQNEKGDKDIDVKIRIAPNDYSSTLEIPHGGVDKDIIDEYTVTFLPASEKGDLEGEYKNQIEMQKEGLNKMTAKAFLDNRFAFLDRAKKDPKGSGRDPKSKGLQRKARRDEITRRANVYTEQEWDASERAKAENAAAKKNLTGESFDGFVRGQKSKLFKKNKKKAKGELKGQAALHDPDQVAGGKAEVEAGRFGDSGINSSIGSQWRTRIDGLHKHAVKEFETLTAASKEKAKMNVKVKT